MPGAQGTLHICVKKAEQEGRKSRKGGGEKKRKEKK